MATEEICRPGRAGSCRAGADQRARARTPASRLSADRHARRRQDDDCKTVGQEPQLRDRGHGDAMRRMPGLHRHRRRPLRRPARARRGVEYRHRQHARDSRQRALRADRRPIQGLPDRRSPHAVEGGVQLDAENTRGAARARQIHPRDDRPAKDPGHRPFALPAVQLEAASGRTDRGAAGRHSSRRGHRFRRRGAGLDRAQRARVDARRTVGARPGDRLRRRRGARSRGAHDARRGRCRVRVSHRRCLARGRRQGAAGRSRGADRAQLVAAGGAR